MFLFWISSLVSFWDIILCKKQSAYYYNFFRDFCETFAVQKAKEKVKPLIALFAFLSAIFLYEFSCLIYAQSEVIVPIILATATLMFLQPFYFVLVLFSFFKHGMPLLLPSRMLVLIFLNSSDSVEKEKSLQNLGPEYVIISLILFLISTNPMKGYCEVFFMKCFNFWQNSPKKESDGFNLNKKFYVWVAFGIIRFACGIFFFNRFGISEIRFIVYVFFLHYLIDIVVSPESYLLLLSYLFVTYDISIFGNLTNYFLGMSSELNPKNVIETVNKSKAVVNATLSLRFMFIAIFLPFLLMWIRFHGAQNGNDGLNLGLNSERIDPSNFGSQSTLESSKLILWSLFGYLSSITVVQVSVFLFSIASADYFFNPFRKHEVRIDGLMNFYFGINSKTLSNLLDKAETFKNRCRKKIQDFKNDVIHCIKDIMTAPLFSSGGTSKVVSSHNQSQKSKKSSDESDNNNKNQDNFEDEKKDNDLPVEQQRRKKYDNSESTNKGLSLKIVLTGYVSNGKSALASAALYECNKRFLEKKNSAKFEVFKKKIDDLECLLFKSDNPLPLIQKSYIPLTPLELEDKNCLLSKIPNVKRLGINGLLTGCDVLISPVTGSTKKEYIQQLKIGSFCENLDENFSVDLIDTPGIGFVDDGKQRGLSYETVQNIIDQSYSDADIFILVSSSADTNFKKLYRDRLKQLRGQFSKASSEYKVAWKRIVVAVTKVDLIDRRPLKGVLANKNSLPFEILHDSLGQFKEFMLSEIKGDEEEKSVTERDLDDVLFPVACPAMQYNPSLLEEKKNYSKQELIKDFLETLPYNYGVEELLSKLSYAFSNVLEIAETKRQYQKMFPILLKIYEEQETQYEDLERKCQELQLPYWKDIVFGIGTGTVSSLFGTWLIPEILVLESPILGAVAVASPLFATGLVVGGLALHFSRKMWIEKDEKKVEGSLSANWKELSKKINKFQETAKDLKNKAENTVKKKSLKLLESDGMEIKYSVEKDYKEIQKEIKTLMEKMKWALHELSTNMIKNPGFTLAKQEKWAVDFDQVQNKKVYEKQTHNCFVVSKVWFEQWKEYTEFGDDQEVRKPPFLKRADIIVEGANGQVLKDGVKPHYLYGDVWKDLLMIQYQYNPPVLCRHPVFEGNQHTCMSP